MKVTFILKDLSEAFFTGNGLPKGHPMQIIGLNNFATNNEKFMYLAYNPVCVNLKITSKFGNGTFRDRVDFNTGFKKDTSFEPSFKIEPRKGYKLATFEFSNI